MVVDLASLSLKLTLFACVPGRQPPLSSDMPYSACGSDLGGGDTGYPRIVDARVYNGPSHAASLRLFPGDPHAWEEGW
jgi:hypothetical protein